MKEHGSNNITPWETMTALLKKIKKDKIACIFYLWIAFCLVFEDFCAVRVNLPCFLLVYITLMMFVVRPYHIYIIYTITGFGFIKTLINMRIAFLSNSILVAHLVWLVHMHSVLLGTAVSRNGNFNNFTSVLRYCALNITFLNHFSTIIFMFVTYILFIGFFYFSISSVNGSYLIWLAKTCRPYRLETLSAFYQNLKQNFMFIVFAIASLQLYFVICCLCDIGLCNISLLVSIIAISRYNMYYTHILFPWLRKRVISIRHSMTSIFSNQYRRLLLNFDEYLKNHSRIMRLTTAFLNTCAKVLTINTFFYKLTKTEIYACLRKFLCVCFKDWFNSADIYLRWEYLVRLIITRVVYISLVALLMCLAIKDSQLLRKLTNNLITVNETRFETDTPLWNTIGPTKCIPKRLLTSSTVAWRFIGEDVQFHCKQTAHLRNLTRATWTKNGQQIKDGLRHSIRYSTGYHLNLDTLLFENIYETTLLIRNVQSIDYGIYACSLEIHAKKLLNNSFSHIHAENTKKFELLQRHPESRYIRIIPGGILSIEAYFNVLIDNRIVRTEIIRNGKLIVGMENPTCSIMIYSYSLASSLVEKFSQWWCRVSLFGAFRTICPCNLMHYLSCAPSNDITVSEANVIKSSPVQTKDKNYVHYKSPRHLEHRKPPQNVRTSYCDKISYKRLMTILARNRSFVDHNIIDDDSLHPTIYQEHLSPFEVTQLTEETLKVSFKSCIDGYSYGSYYFTIILSDINIQSSHTVVHPLTFEVVPAAPDFFNNDYYNLSNSRFSHEKLKCWTNKRGRPGLPCDSYVNFFISEAQTFFLMEYIFVIVILFILWVLFLFSKSIILMIVNLMFRMAPWRESMYSEYNGYMVCNQFDVYISYCDQSYNDHKLFTYVSGVLQRYGLHVYPGCPPGATPATVIPEVIRKSYAAVMLITSEYMLEDYLIQIELPYLLDKFHLNPHRLLILSMDPGETSISSSAGPRKWNLLVNKRTHVVEDWAWQLLSLKLIVHPNLLNHMYYQIMKHFVFLKHCVIDDLL